MKSHFLFGLLFVVSIPVAGVGIARSEAIQGEKVVLENQRVRVLEYNLKPGVAMGMHKHPRDRVEITLTDGRVRVTTEDGKAQESLEKAGAVVFQKADAARHDVINIGNTVLRAYHVELK
ncbi:MAG TPA: cupin domain-containing protein [Acidobacteriota bacterium]|jgi:quercetin dioxygenase-like cupin family protein|nr:cupin domain-containing protein [Acidobacteriota bacterium]